MLPHEKEIGSGGAGSMDYRTWASPDWACFPGGATREKVLGGEVKQWKDIP